MTIETTPTQSKSNWVKQAYFYIVMIGCIVAFSIATVTVLQKTLTKYVFPKANYDWMFGGYGGYSMETQCQGELMNPVYPSRVMAPGEAPIVPPAPAQDKIDKCIAEKKQQEIDRKEADFQSNVLNSMLTLLVTAIIFFVHIKYIKPKI